MILIPAIILASVLNTIIHEAGHLFFSLLLLPGEKIELCFGAESGSAKQKKLSFHLGRVKVTVYPGTFIFFRSDGYCLVQQKDYKVWKDFLINLGGPLFNLITFLVYYTSLAAVPNIREGFTSAFSTVFLLLNLFTFLHAMIPLKYKDGTTSDGYKAFDLLRYWLKGYSTTVFTGKLMTFIHLKQYEEAKSYFETIKRFQEKIPEKDMVSLSLLLIPPAEPAKE